MLCFLRSRLLPVFVGLTVPVGAAFGQMPTVSFPPVLSTSGQGESKVTPDRAAITVNVQTRGATAALAANDNAFRTRAVLDALAKLGLPREQLTTEGYSVYPEMRYDKDGTAPRVAAYVVTNSIRAETRHTDQAGAIVDAALGAGANMINGLSFYASSIDEARRQAIAAAVVSAHADADAMARAAGGTIGSLIELSTGGPTVPPRPMYDLSMRAKAMQGAEPTPVNPGPQTISVFVTAKWQFVSSRP